VGTQSLYLIDKLIPEKQRAVSHQLL